MNVGMSNLGKPDHGLIKKVADYMLYTLPLLSPLVVTMPVSDNIQKWVLIAVNVTVVLFKGFSKFTASDNTNL
jgi:hypothetical protein